MAAHRQQVGRGTQPVAPSHHRHQQGHTCCRFLRPGQLVCAQVTLGILNVRLNLPLPVAVAHNAGAVLLLFTMVSLLARLRRPD